MGALRLPTKDREACRKASKGGFAAPLGPWWASPLARLDLCAAQAAARVLCALVARRGNKINARAIFRAAGGFSLPFPYRPAFLDFRPSGGPLWAILAPLCRFFAG